MVKCLGIGAVTSVAKNLLGVKAVYVRNGETCET
ncbi:hypothetical protein EZS27_029598, partial [termite gut metagenome]